MAATEETIAQVEELSGVYEAGFITEIETDKAPKGLSEDIVRFISAKKNEPEWMLEKRLKAYNHWLKMPEPDWAKLEISPIDYQDSYYYAAPKSMENAPESLDDVDPILLETYAKLGIPLREQEILAGVKNRLVSQQPMTDGGRGGALAAGIDDRMRPTQRRERFP